MNNIIEFKIVFNGFNLNDFDLIKLKIFDITF